MAQQEYEGIVGWGPFSNPATWAITDALQGQNETPSGAPATTGPNVGDTRFLSPTGETQTWDGSQWVTTSQAKLAHSTESNPVYDNSGGSGGSGGSSFTNTDAARSATQSSLDSLDTELATGIGNVDKGYYGLVGGTMPDGTKITGKYETETAKVDRDYNKGVVDNNNALSRNRHNALLAAAQGSRGLRGTLASLGALSGDGSFLANEAVQNAANIDLGGASETYKTNAGNLDDAYEDYKDENEARIAAAKAERATNTLAEEGRIASKRQGYLAKMAELWAQAGNDAEAARYLKMTEPLNDVIAKSAGITPSAYSPGNAAFTPGSLEAYLAGGGDMSVSVAGGAGNGLAAPTLRAGYTGRDREKEKY